jgi:hypothetical protein
MLFALQLVPSFFVTSAHFCDEPMVSFTQNGFCHANKVFCRLYAWGSVFGEDILQNHHIQDPTHPDGIKFRLRIRVPYSVFQSIVLRNETSGVKTVGTLQAKHQGPRGSAWQFIICFNTKCRLPSNGSADEMAVLLNFKFCLVMKINYFQHGVLLLFICTAG